MKFKAGDKTDSDHCIALQHEFLRCHDAFEEFKAFVTILILKGDNRWLTYRAYNAYSGFIHHLCEFMRGAHAREAGNTKITNKKLTQAQRAKLDEAYITHHAQRLLINRRMSIENGTAPAWENDISYYPERIPPEFAREFREYRNKVHGHVTHERTSKLSLSQFYRRYHKYLVLLYHDACWWMPREQEFPDLQEITAFSLLAKSEYRKSVDSDAESAEDKSSGQNSGSNKNSSVPS